MRLEAMRLEAMRLVSMRLVSMQEARHDDQSGRSRMSRHG
jgi:hypothetical protein